MKPIEIFQVSVEEWIFIVPFYFHGNCVASKLLDVIDFVGTSECRLLVDPLFNPKITLLPAAFRKRPAQPLRDRCLAAAAANHFDDGNGYNTDESVQFLTSFGKIPMQYGVE